jgi:hypothetical protein
MRALNVFLSFAISILLAVLVFEGGLRLFPAFRPADTVNEFHPRLGWVKQPGAEVDRTTAEFDITFDINSRGLRDDAMPSIEKKESSFRVMMLGDSFVLGYTVDREDLFVDLLEGLWRSEQRRVEVINAGTEGYSTDQEVLWFQEYGVEYEPDLVLLFPYENDIYWNGQDSYSRFPKPRFDRDGNLETGDLQDPGPGPRLPRWAIGNFLIKMVFPYLPSGSGPPDHHFLPPDQPADEQEWIYSELAPLFHTEPPFLADCLARTRGALGALKQSCEEIDARLIMVPIPSEAAIQPGEMKRWQEDSKILKDLDSDLWSPDRPVDQFLALGQELGIETLDPRSTLKAAFNNGKKPLYFHNEWHFNPHGNQVFADFLRDEMKAARVFPQDHAAIGEGSYPVPEPEGGVPFPLILFGVLWLFLGGGYLFTYRDEAAPLAFLKVGGLLAVVFTIFLGGSKLLARIPPQFAPWLVFLFVLGVLGFVVWKLGRRVATIFELLRAFTLRGHWYLMPLVVVLLTIGSLLVVAASSPLIAPFIYTLF